MWTPQQTIGLQWASISDLENFKHMNNNSLNGNVPKQFGTLPKLVHMEVPQPHNCFVWLRSIILDGHFQVLLVGFSPSFFLGALF
jgi:hypothetical protein